MAFLSDQPAPKLTSRSSVDEIIHQILVTARQHFAMDLAFCSSITADRQTVTATDGLEDFGMEPGTVLDASGSYCIRLLRGEINPAISDTSAVPSLRDLETTRLGNIGSYISVPIHLSDGRIYGTLCGLAHAASPGLEDAPLESLRLLADIAGKAIERQAVEALDRHDSASRIRGVIQAGSFHTVFQPIRDIRNREIAGIESLLRVDAEPHRSPDLWVIESGHAAMAEEFELAAAGRALGALAGLEGRTYSSVNLSAASVISPAFEAMVREFEPKGLLVEVTERDAVADYDELRSALARLRSLGVGLAVDDAGAGYSSLEHIVRLVPDVIKLDMFLTREIHLDPVKRALAGALRAFGSDIGASVVAEGVESEGELETLVDLGFEYGQGYLLGRPGELSALAMGPWATPAAPTD